MYDVNGRKKQVTIGSHTNKPQVTRFTYNAFGQEVKRAQLEAGRFDETGAKTLISYRYYNTLGQHIASVDAGRYITKQTYNAFGELASSTEIAAPVDSRIALSEHTLATVPQSNDSFGANRTTEFFYDQMGRVTHTVYKNVSVQRQGSAELTYVSERSRY